MNKKYLIALILVFISTGCRQETHTAAPELSTLQANVIPQLEEYIHDLMAAYDLPGLSIAIVQGNEIIYTHGFGVREKGGSAPVTDETLMMIGSATKSTTTMMMARLIDEGHFNWDTPVQEIWPDFALSDLDLSPQVTMRHTVCNCSGVPMRNSEIVFNYNQLSAEDVMTWLSTAPLVGRFGKTFQYSNQMVAAGGYLAALAVGGRYGNLYPDYLSIMQSRVLDPIGMDRSTFSFQEVYASGNYALPHIPTLDTGYMLIDPIYEEWTIPIAPAGGLWSNAHDMGRYLVTQLNGGLTPDGDRVVSAENLAVTHQAHVRVDARQEYGLGWTIENYDGLTIINHPGGSAGFTTDMAMIPELDLGIVVLVNQMLMPQHTMLFPAVRYRLIELVLDQPASYHSFAEKWVESNQAQWAVLNSQAHQTDSQFEIEAYLGTYQNETLGEVELRFAEDGILLFDAGEFITDIRPIKDSAGSFMFAWGTHIGKTMRIQEQGAGRLQFELPDPMTGPERSYIFVSD